MRIYYFAQEIEHLYAENSNGKADTVYDCQGSTPVFRPGISGYEGGKKGRVPNDANSPEQEEPDKNRW